MSEECDVNTKHLCGLCRTEFRVCPEDYENLVLIDNVWYPHCPVCSTVDIKKKEHLKITREGIMKALAIILTLSLLVTPWVFYYNLYKPTEDYGVLAPSIITYVVQVVACLVLWVEVSDKWQKH